MRASRRPSTPVGAAANATPRPGRPWPRPHGPQPSHGREEQPRHCRQARRPRPARPLAHIYLAKSGVATMCSAGRANHAGLMAVNAYNSFLNEKSSHPAPSRASGTVDGNDCAYGIETENLGDGKDVYPKAQYDAWVRINAAFCRHYGWSAKSCGGHLETSIEGKIDPRGPVEGYGDRGKFALSMGQFRKDVAERLKHKASWSPGAARTYTVVDGDTLWSIAVHELGSGARYAEIKTLNRLASDALSVGQKLTLPEK
ncbi:N-acetylmuramoyl-L-alanine amidase [Streptomyces aureus]